MIWLRLTHPAMVHPSVRRCQEILIALGERVEPDGVYGLETASAVERQQRRLGVTADRIWGPATRSAAWRALARDPRTGVSRYEQAGVTVWDCRLDATALDHHTSGRYRDWAGIDTIMLHSTGCRMPEYDTVPAAWDRVHVHAGVTHQGDVVILRALPLDVGHGTRLNARTIGVEIAGNRPGIVGVPGSHWAPGGGPHDLTPAQVRGAHVLAEIIVEEARAFGGEIRHVIAHRQTDMNREADPGQEVWRQIALPWCERYGWGDLDGRAYGGRSIPRDWDPSSSDRYWG